MAPARKQDPGELFDWPGLANAGIGLWPTAGAHGTAWDGSDDQVATLLTRLGYDPAIATFAETLTAFQRHWHPEALDQPADAETVRRLHSLLAQAGR
jgi:N-acetylmuramoyl-L-alanine amidase